MHKQAVAEVDDASDDFACQFKVEVVVAVSIYVMHEQVYSVSLGEYLRVADAAVCRQEFVPASLPLRAKECLAWYALHLHDCEGRNW